MKSKPVLIIEDDANIRDMYGDALTIAGIEVLKASSGEEGVQLALENHPSVILVDIMLPNMNGPDVVKKIREDAWGKNARFIFLTNMTSADDIYQAVQQKPEEYIIKVHTSVKDVVNKVRMAMYK